MNKETKNNYNLFFSKIYDFIFFPFLHPIRKKIAAEVKNNNPQNLIDMCCGTANQIKYLKKSVNTNIVGIDISDNMLSVASKKTKTNICLKQDASNTNFPDNFFDVAILSFILHETQPEIAYKISNEAKRIVKNSGKIYLTDYVFDKKTNFLGKAGTYFVEFLVGGQHYKNFKTYIKNNLLKNYTTDLQFVSESKYIFGAIRVFTFINNKN